LGKEVNWDSPRAEYTAALLRHFIDLRDGTHGGVTSRRDKEGLFAAAVAMVDTDARQVLDEINAILLLDTGKVTATGVRSSGGGVEAVWALSWPEEQALGINPIVVRAFYSAGSHHPHLQGGTVGDRPLNAFDEEQASALLPTLRDIASAGIHNLVFQAGYRLVRAILAGHRPR
jgi:hypothetical protein